MTIITIPIYLYQYQIYLLVKYKPKHFAYLDIFSYGSIIDSINANNSSPLRKSTTENGITTYSIDPKANDLEGLFLQNIV